MPPKKPLSAPEHHSPQQPCPCGSQESLAHCCLPYINGTRIAPTAEALMRSRYSAHATLAIDYLWQTWHQTERQGSNRADIRRWAKSCEWLRLEILATQQGGPDDKEGIVEFIAHFRRAGELQQHHEISHFTRSPQGWLYLNQRDTLA